MEVERLPIIITKNKRKILFEAIVGTLISGLLLYGIFEVRSSSGQLNIIFEVITLVCVVLTIITWYRYFQRFKILIKLSETGISFRNREIKWESIDSCYITKSPELKKYIHFKLKDSESELKFKLDVEDIPVASLIKTVRMFSERYGFEFLVDPPTP